MASFLSSLCLGVLDALNESGDNMFTFEPKCFEVHSSEHNLGAEQHGYLHRSEEY